MPRGLNLRPHILTALGNPSCERTYGQTISGKTSGHGSRAKSGSRLLLWLVDGFNPNVAWLELSECCGLCSHGVNPNSGVGVETRVTQNSVPGEAAAHGKEESKNEAEHPLIPPCYLLLLWDSLS